MRYLLPVGTIIGAALYDLTNSRGAALLALGLVLLAGVLVQIQKPRPHG